MSEISVDKRLKSGHLLSIVSDLLLSYLLAIGLKYFSEKESLLQLSESPFNCNLFLNSLSNLQFQSLVIENMNLTLLNQVSV